MNNIYKIFKYMTQDEKSMEEILDLANIKAPTLYKYMHLFKKAGFDVVRVKKFYKIIHYSNKIKLSDAEMGLIAYLKLLASMFISKSKNKIFSELIEKLLKFTNKETQEAVNNKFSLMKKASETNMYKEKLELFEKYLNSNMQTVVTLRNGKQFLLQPKEVIFKNKKIYFSFIDNKTLETKQIDINKIVNLTSKPNYNPIHYETKEIIFELYGRLAKVYLLKEGERVLDSSSDKIVIANNNSDKKALFKRLLRYDTLCKVKFPKKDALIFKKLIEKSLENIDNIKDNILKEDLI